MTGTVESHDRSASKNSLSADSVVLTRVDAMQYLRYISVIFVYHTTYSIAWSLSAKSPEESRLLRKVLTLSISSCWPV
jgi:hypothetical protein